MVGSTTGAAADPPAFSTWYPGQSRWRLPLSSMRTARHFSKFCPRTPSMLTPFRKTDAASNKVGIMPGGSLQTPARSRFSGVSAARGTGVGQARIRAVRVDGLEALRLDLPAGEAPVPAQAGAHLPDQVLHEPGPLVGALGDPLLVRALEQRVEVAGRALLDQGDQVLQPEEAREPDLDAHQAALVVRPVAADRLAARAEAGHRHFHRHPQLVGARGHAGAVGAGVVDQALGAAHRGALLDEVGEAHGDVGSGGVMVAAQLGAERAEAADVDLAAVPVEQLDEAAHVRPAPPVRERHAHVDLRHRVLLPVHPIQHADRVPQALHPGPLQGKLPPILLAVHIPQLPYKSRFGNGSRTTRFGLTQRARRVALGRGFFGFLPSRALRSLRETVFHGRSSSPRRMTVARPVIQARRSEGFDSGRSSISIRPGRPSSSPWVKTSLRGTSAGTSCCRRSARWPEALPVTGSSDTPWSAKMARSAASTPGFGDSANGTNPTTPSRSARAGNAPASPRTPASAARSRRHR